MISNYSLKGKAVEVLKHNYKTLLVLVLLLILAGLVTWSVTRTPGSVVSDSSPAAISLGIGGEDAYYTDLSGDAVQLSGYFGKVIVANSWASWSPDSVTELQLLNSLSAEYSSNDVQFLAINRAEPVHTAQSFLQAFGIGDRVKLLLDKDDYYYQSIGGYNVPETLVYDTQGNVIRHFRGEVSKSALVSIINEGLIDKN